MKMPEYVEQILRALDAGGFEAFCVGGCVRDAAMGREPYDYDIATSAKPEQITQIFKDKKCIFTGIKHGTVTVISSGKPIEVTTYRIDGRYADNRHPQNVVFTDSLTDDLSRRDFTVNAMAYNGVDFADPFGGIDDIRLKKIRAIGNPDERFNEDGLRVMRAVRFSAQLGFEVEENTAQSIRRNMDLLDHLSAERVFAELRKLLGGRYCAEALGKFPELSKKIFGTAPEEATLKALKKTDIFAFRLALMLLTTGAETALKRLRADRNTLKKVLFLINSYNTYIPCTDSGIRTYMFREKIGTAELSEALSFRSIVNPSFRSAEYQKILDSIKANNECYNYSGLHIRGSDLKNIVKTDKEIGKLLEKLLLSVIDGKTENEKTALKQAAQTFYNLDRDIPCQ